MATTLERLAELSAGLLFLSESEAPLEVYEWQGEEPFTPAALLKQHGYPEGTALAEVDVDTFFRPMLREQDWHGPSEKETVKRYEALVKELKKSLDNIKVYRVGTISIDAYVLGTLKDGPDQAPSVAEGASADTAAAEQAEGANKAASGKDSAAEGANTAASAEDSAAADASFTDSAAADANKAASAETSAAEDAGKGASAKDGVEADKAPGGKGGKVAGLKTHLVET